MNFHHKSILIALLAMLVPIILHLLNRRSAKLIDWGAMQFLLGSLVSRRHRLLLEEMLLLALRCLLFALAALAIAQPFAYPDSRTPWALVLPAILLGAVALGVGTAFWSERIWRYRLWAAGCLLLLLAAGLVALENRLQLVKQLGADRDVAIVIDGSYSMNLKTEGQANFKRAVAEAQSLVESIGDSSTLTVVVAGAAPKVVTNHFLTQRDEMETTLKDLKPVGGTSSLRSAIQAAWTKLQDAPHRAKQIVLFTDQQKDGWEIDDVGRWQETATQLKADGSPPQIVVRTLPLPKTVRNVTISQLATSRTMIGTDRPVTFQVQVANTGSEAVSAAKIRLLVDGKPVEEKLYSRLNAGESATETFSYRFERAGAKVIEARIDSDDDLPDDNSRLLSVRVIDRLPVLLVNGSSSTEFLEQATAYIQLALVPDDTASRDESVAEQRTAGSLIAATVEDAGGLSRLKNFDKYRVVVLADVPRLTLSAANRLADFVAHGGGLLVAPGKNALPDFYNNWKRSDGRGPLLPATLESRQALTADASPAHWALSTFAHPVLAQFGDVKKSDLNTAVFRSYWKLAPATSKPLESGGNFTGGEPILIEQRVGAGTVLMLASSLDATGSNLATRKAFPVLVHSLVYHLAGAARGGLTYDAGPQVVLTLPAETSRAVAYRRWQSGLQGSYFTGSEFNLPPALTRADSQLDFNWLAVKPVPEIGSDKYAVRWTGALVPPKTESYRLFLSGQGAGRLWLDGKPLITRPNPGTAEATADMRAGSRYELQVEEVKTTGQGGAKLEWATASLPRQVVPTTGLAFATESTTGDSDEDAFVVTAPDGQSQRVQGEIHDGILTVNIPSAAAPGVYQVRPPDQFQSVLTSAVDERQRVPVAVTTNVREFNLAQAGDEDWKSLKSLIGLERAEDFKALIARATGNVPEQELWKYLILAALVILIAEIAVTRWIAHQRQVTASPVGDFQQRDQASEASLKKFLIAGTARGVSAGSKPSVPGAVVP